MITLLVGENSFDVGRAISQISDDFDGTVEKIDGGDLQFSQFADLVTGTSLFADKRTVIIKNLSDNKQIWSALIEWLPRLSDDVHLVLVEPKPDKRTSTYKALAKDAHHKEFANWSDRDVTVAEKWVSEESISLGLSLDKKSIQTLVQWVGLDQWQLYNSLEKLRSVDTVNSDIIKDIIPPNPTENVFNLFETAVTGDIAGLSQMVNTLEQTEDVYRLVALMSSQVFQLAAVASADKDHSVAKDFGIHPYVVGRLSSLAKRLGKGRVASIVGIFIELDDSLKTSIAEPWLLVEKALMKVANI
ncbi:DNA polymerase III subunit delta [Candidatus Saccharibacteria bacterium]|nr:DNA polymerase III subunit delta [Candidatus Saccharibacteria bacterium]